jgi:hypothetical protein
VGSLTGKGNEYYMNVAPEISTDSCTLLPKVVSDGNARQHRQTVGVSRALDQDPCTTMSRCFMANHSVIRES